MEAAGLALAILPLLLNQLDNYVQGLETIGDFRTRKYRRRLESYLTKLGNEQTFFADTLGRSLEGIVEYEDVDESEKVNQLKQIWEKPNLQAMLQEKLGSQYRPFLRTMAELSDLLKKLSDRLGWGELPENVTWDDPISFKREFKKLKIILSKSVYNDLFDQINMANQQLEKLVEHSDRLETTRRRTRKRRPLHRLKRARRLAHSLYSALVKGKYWNCACRDHHAIHFALSSSSFDFNDTTDSSTKARFRIIFASPTPIGVSHTLSQLYEVELESETLDLNATGHIGDLSLGSVAGAAHGNRARRQVSFATQAPHNSSACTYTQCRECCAAPSSISDLCLAISSIRADHQPQPLGVIMEGTNKHTIYPTGNIIDSSNWQRKSLEALLASSSNVLEVHRTGGYLFSQEDRLRVAVNLACSVLQLHGNWLKSPWRATDIMFREPFPTAVNTPYVIWDVGSSTDTATMCQDNLDTALIRSKILFPLGIVLVELSLGQTLRYFRKAEDHDQNEATADLKTAARLLKYYVAQQSGPAYHAVVERCLFWNGNQESSLEKEETQDEIFQEIVLPLVDNLKNFEKVALAQNMQL